MPEIKRKPVAVANGTAPKPATVAIDLIAKDLLPLAVPIKKLIPDPLNARKHPERNMEVIIQSLKMYGQRTPLVVNKRNNHVEKGNGTLAAAKALGWTKIAAIFEDDAPHIAAGYGLIDNRSAELAQWDFAVVAKIEKLLSEKKEDMPGWSMEELATMRMGDDWSPLPPKDPMLNIPTEGTKTSDVVFGQAFPEHNKATKRVMEILRMRQGDPELNERDALMIVCVEWLEVNGHELEEDTANA